MNPPSRCPRLLVPALALALLVPLAPSALAAPGAVLPPVPSAASTPTADADAAGETAADAFAPTAATAAKVEQLEADVASLNARAKEIGESLTKATIEYGEGEKALVAAEARAEEALDQAVAAQRVADAARDKVGDFARDTYINPVPTSASVLSSASGDVTEAARGAEYLAHIGRDNGETVTVATDASDDASAKRAEADRLSAAAEQQKELLATRLEDIRTETAEASAELTARAQELNTARLQAASEVAAAEQAAQQAAAEAAQAQAEALAAASMALVTTPGATTMTAGAGNVDPGLADLCSSPMPTTYPTSAEWGGYSNGLIPESALCAIGPDGSGQRARWDAAIAFEAMSAAYAETFGEPICITDSYRDYAGQVSVRARKPTLAAVPGTSRHGWGLALDLCGGIQSFGTKERSWMVANAARFGWFSPGWAQAGGSKPEAWHWEFGHLS